MTTHDYQVMALAGLAFCLCFGGAVVGGRWCERFGIAMIVSGGIVLALAGFRNFGFL